MSLFKRNSSHQGMLLYDRTPQSNFADQIRSLTTYLQQNHANVQILQITSAKASEGKSVLATNLALANAKIGQKTLLVDTNFNYPSIQTSFELKNPHNLIDAINSSANVHPNPTQFSNLDVMPTKQSDTAVSDTLARPRLKQLIADWRQTYDLIIFDSSDLLTNPSAQIIATLCDATLLSVNIGKTTKESLAHAKTTLTDVQATILGCVAVKQ